MLRACTEPGGWPAVLEGQAAVLLALQQQLADSQWWPAERLRAAQFEQLATLVAFAREAVPFYAARLDAAGLPAGAALTPEAWSRLPVLSRHDVRQAGEALHATSFPAAHGGFFEISTGGSTGIPVRVRKTDLARLMWQTGHVRGRLWHQEDPGGTLVRLLSLPPGTDPQILAALYAPEGVVLENWGGVDELLWRTGKFAGFSDTHPIADQVRFVQTHQANHILTMPANLRLLLSYCRQHGVRLPDLRSVWTQSEIVDDTLRAACREVLGCEIIDNYSAAETGFLALQCPESGQNHIQAETMLVEILDAAGHACQPGEIGRVVVTPLHNFATPLLRYEIGDEAEVGAPCRCGRGLSVLRRVVGRSTDYLTLPSGEQRRPQLGYYQLAKIRTVTEFQYVQRSLQQIELMLVVERPLTAAEEAEIRQMVVVNMGPEFGLTISCHASLPRTKAGKLRPFVSDLVP